MKKTLRRVRDALRRLNRSNHVDLRLTVCCPVPWEDMAPTNEPCRRHCAICERDVLDLVGRSPSEVLAILRGSEHLCGQVMARADGRVVFGQCAADDGGMVMRGGLSLGG